MYACIKTCNAVHFPNRFAASIPVKSKIAVLFAAEQKHFHPRLNLKLASDNTYLDVLHIPLFYYPRNKVIIFFLTFASLQYDLNVHYL